MSMVPPEGTDTGSSDEMEDPGNVLSPFEDDDDEGTMDEEEAVSDDNSRVNELDDLREESEIPLDKLRAMYDSWRKVELPNTEDQVKTKGDHNEPSNISSQEQQDLSENMIIQTSEHDKMDKTVESSVPPSIADKHVAPMKFTFPGKAGTSRQYLESFKMKSTPYDKAKISSEDYAKSRPGPSGVSQKSTIPTFSGGNKRRLGDECDQSENKRSALHLLNKQLSDDEESSDEDYLPPDFEDRMIMVGSDYQAVIPAFSSKRPEFDDMNVVDDDGDKLLWTPDVLSQEDVEKYLTILHNQKRGNPGGSLAIHPAANNGQFLKDDEQALFNLMESEFKIEESLRRVGLNAIPEKGSAWSQEECTSFEEGLCTNGKDFRQIQKEKVRTRTLGEVCQFYYLWKKSDRYYRLLVECKKKNENDLANQKAGNNGKSTAGLGLEFEKRQLRSSQYNEPDVERKGSKRIDSKTHSLISQECKAVNDNAKVVTKNTGHYNTTNRMNLRKKSLRAQKGDVLAPEVLQKKTKSDNFSSRKYRTTDTDTNTMAKKEKGKAATNTNIKYKQEGASANKVKNGNGKAGMNKVVKQGNEKTVRDNIISKLNKGKPPNKTNNKGNENAVTISNKNVKNVNEKTATNQIVKKEHKGAFANKVVKIDKTATNRNVKDKNKEVASYSKTGKNVPSAKTNNLVNSVQKGDGMTPPASKRILSVNKLGQIVMYDDISIPNEKETPNRTSGACFVQNNFNKSVKKEGKKSITNMKTGEEKVLPKKGNVNYPVDTASITCNANANSLNKPVESLNKILPKVNSATSSNETKSGNELEVGISEKMCQSKQIVPVNLKNYSNAVSLCPSKILKVTKESSFPLVSSVNNVSLPTNNIKVKTSEASAVRPRSDVSGLSRKPGIRIPRVGPRGLNLPNAIRPKLPTYDPLHPSCASPLNPSTINPWWNPATQSLDPMGNHSRASQASSLNVTHTQESRNTTGQVGHEVQEKHLIGGIDFSQPRNLTYSDIQAMGDIPYPLYSFKDYDYRTAMVLNQRAHKIDPIIERDKKLRLQFYRESVDFTQRFFERFGKPELPPGFEDSESDRALERRMIEYQKKERARRSKEKKSQQKKEKKSQQKKEKNIPHDVSSSKTNKIKSRELSSDAEDNMTLDKRLSRTCKRNSKKTAKANTMLSVSVNNRRNNDDENRKVTSLPSNEGMAEISKINSEVVTSRKRGRPPMKRATSNNELKDKKTPVTPSFKAEPAITRSSTGATPMARSGWRLTSCLHCGCSDVKLPISASSVAKRKRTCGSPAAPGYSKSLLQGKDTSVNTDGTKAIKKVKSRTPANCNKIQESVSESISQGDKKNGIVYPPSTLKENNSSETVEQPGISLKRRLESKKAETMIQSRDKEEGVMNTETSVKRTKLEFPKILFSKRKHGKRTGTSDEKSDDKPASKCNLNLAASKRLKRGRPPKIQKLFDVSHGSLASSSCSTSVSKSTSRVKKSMNEKNIKLKLNGNSNTKRYKKEDYPKLQENTRTLRKTSQGYGNSRLRTLRNTRKIIKSQKNKRSTIPIKTCKVGSRGLKNFNKKGGKGSVKAESKKQIIKVRRSLEDSTRKKGRPRLHNTTEELLTENRDIQEGKDSQL